ncbi:non-ribosomal peptide synthetase [uncultured Kordia sp.]|uniref:non-ribosomal peptide synthetase n=1 Tax=uncultured Kordia sp. TaxID=507699 RepID=UPI002619CB88|nr:non-ribosomal peptide synthetase [uncultured Kordia sp.]
MERDFLVKRSKSELFWLHIIKNSDELQLFSGSNANNTAVEAVYEEQYFDFAQEIRQQLFQVSNEDVSSAFLLLTTTLNILLYKYTYKNDILVTTGNFGEASHNEEINTLLFLQAEIDANKTPKQLIHSILENLNNVSEHQNYDFDSLMNKLKANGFDNENILYNCGLTFNRMTKQSSLTDKIKLRFDVVDENDTLSLKIRYDNAKYSKDQIKQLGTHYITALNSLLNGIEIPVKDLQILTPQEENTIVADFNQTDYNVNTTQNVVQRFEEQVRQGGNNAAVYINGRSFSYHEINEITSKLAAYLRNNHNIQQKDIVGLMVEPSEFMLIGMLGILKAGAAYLPIGIGQPKEQISHILKDANVKMILTDSSIMFDLIEYYQGELFALDIQLADIEESKDNLELTISPEDVAYVIYTSGTTGKPKGVQIKHSALVNYVGWMQEKFQVTEKDSSIMLSTYAFDLGYTALWGTILNGASIHLIEESLVKQTNALIEYLVSNNISYIKLTPSLFYLFKHANNYESLQNSNIRLILLGGEAIRTDDIKSFYNLKPDVTFVNHYGPTECTIGCVAHRIDKTNFESFESEVVIGKPINNTKAYVLDKNLKVVPVGVAGELYISGKGLALGYINNQSLTNEKFINHPFIEEELLYKTGDSVKWTPNGTLEFLGRIDRQVKIRGYRVELQEVEQVLGNKPELDEVAVTVWKDEEGIGQLVAYVKSSEAQDIANLKAYLGKILPAYKIPSYFVQVDSFSLTGNGKINYKVLPNPKEAGIGVKDQYLAPQSILEKEISRIWEEVLGKKKIGIKDNYFELGGDSLKGIRIVNQLQDYLKEIVHVSLLFDAPTIQELAVELNREATDFADKVNESDIEKMNSIITPLPDYPVNESKNDSAVFILAPPRSGSTLLRVIMAGHPDLFVPPELQLMIFNTLQGREKELDGKLSFYKEGNIRAIMELLDFDNEKATEMMNDFIKEDLSVQEYYAKMQSWIGDRILVDKSPSYARDINVLRRIEQTFKNAKFIHLQRNPYGLIHSYEDTRMDQVFRYKHDFDARKLGELEWLVSHQNIVEFFKEIPDNRKHVVKFEDMVKDSSQVAASLCDFLEMENHQEQMLKIYEDSENRMTDGIHAESNMIGDIKFFRHKKIDPKVADKWKDAYKEEFLCEQTQNLAESLGYLKGAEKVTAIQPLGELAYYEASHAQKRLWIIDQFEESKLAYTQPRVFTLKGKLDTEAFEMAFNTLVDRHESLRTTFISVDGVPKQKIHNRKEYGFKVEFTDLRDTSQKEKQEAAIIQAETNKEFDLEKGSLLRVHLLRINDEKNTLLFNTHHIISDGWSMQIIIDEVIKLYNSFKNQQPINIAPLRIQYKDFTAWQNSHLQGENLAKHANYWKSRFQGEVPVLDLPTDRQRSSVRSGKGESKGFLIEKTIQENLHKICREKGVTLFMLLTASVKTLLYKYTGQEDIVIGTPTAGRDHSELENQVGFYVNTLALRTEFSTNDNFDKLLDKVRKNTLEAYKHKVYPFDKLVDDLQITRDMSRSPLFDVMIILQNIEVTNGEEYQFEGIITEEVDTNFEANKIDVNFEFQETKDGLWVEIGYNAALFDEWRMEACSKHLKTLLQEIIDDVEKPIKEINILGKEEEQRLSAMLNQSDIDFPLDKNIHTLFEEQVEKFPNKIAVVYKNNSLTYNELNTKANQLAHYLRKEYDIKPDDFVALSLNRSESMIIAIIAIFKAGGVYVPIDANYPIERKEFILNDVKPKVLITERTLFWNSNTLQENQLFYIAEQTTILNNLPTHNPENQNAANDLAYVIYTSGSTGLPKGVMIEHSSYVNIALDHIHQFSINEKDHVLQFFSLSFDVSMCEIFMALFSGAALYVTGKQLVEDLDSFENYIQYNDISVIALPPAFLSSIRKEKLTSLRVILTGGEPPKLEEAIEISKTSDYYNVYGPTECAICSTSYKITEADKNRESLPIGKPIANMEVFILNKDMQQCPVGVNGEICIAGPGLARGYVNRPTFTKEKFVTFEAAKNHKIYKTGDIGKLLPDGNIEFIGRNDEQVKIRGFRIELGEIETVMVKLKAVSEAAVVMMKDSSNAGYLAAFVTGHENINISEVRSQLMNHLPEYMIPSTFTALETMPLTTNGKIDRRKLHTLAKQAGRTEAYVAPSSDTEKILSEIWNELLGSTEISVKSNFFELGGHSLSASQMVSRIHEKLNVKLDLKQIFSEQTIQGIAKAIENSQETDTVTIVPVKEQQYYDVSHGQKRLWFLDQLEPGLTAYNMSAAYDLENINEELFKEAFNSLLHRHEILRTTFSTVDGVPKQKIHKNLEDCGLKIEVFDWRNVPAKEEEAKALAKEETEISFDLENGPLVRAKLVCLEDNRHLFLLSMHHIISDGWSMKVLVNDLLKIYNSLLKGDHEELTPLTLQYKDYAAWQHKFLESDQMKQVESYWFNKFSGKLPVLELPRDFSRDEKQTFNGKVLGFLLDDKKSNQFVNLGKENTATNFITFMAVVNVLLHKYCNQNDIIVGTTVTGRPQRELENQIGFYINMLPIRNTIDEQQTFNEFLNSVKQEMLDAYENQMYPFDKLISELQLQRDKRRGPLFDVLVTQLEASDEVSENQVNSLLSNTGLEVATFEREKEQHSKQDLRFALLQEDNNIGISIRYNPLLFKEERMQIMQERMEDLINDIVNNPDKKIEELSCASDYERTQNVHQLKTDFSF